MVKLPGGIAGVIYLITNALITDPFWTSIVFAIVLAGLPVYYAFFKDTGAAQL